MWDSKNNRGHYATRTALMSKTGWYRPFSRDLERRSHNPFLQTGSLPADGCLFPVRNAQDPDGLAKSPVVETL